VSFYVVIKKQIVEGLELKEGSEFQGHGIYVKTLGTSFCILIVLWCTLNNKYQGESTRNLLICDGFFMTDSKNVTDGMPPPVVPILV